MSSLIHWQLAAARVDELRGLELSRAARPSLTGVGQWRRAKPQARPVAGRARCH